MFFNSWNNPTIFLGVKKMIINNQSSLEVNDKSNSIAEEKSTSEVRSRNISQPKKESISVSLLQVRKALLNAYAKGYEISFDKFREEIMYKSSNTDGWQRFEDNDYTKLRMSLEKEGLKNVGKEMIRDMVLYIAKMKYHDSAIIWLTDEVPQWDGINRIDTFLSKYFGAEDNRYTRSCSQYLWSSLAGRILNPGVKADMVIVIIGDQGCGKSTGVAAICPDLEFFTEIDFNDKDADQARKMLGRLVGEISELKGLRTKDEESIKALVSRTNDEWIKKFREFPSIYARRITFIGTTNENNFLSDISGNRRWLPINVKNVDVESIKQDRLQLYAEARQKYLLNGIEFKEAEELAKDVIKNHLIVDPWFEVIKEWIDGKAPGIPPADPFRVSTREVLKYALGFDDQRIDRRSEMKVTGVLKILGYTKRRERTGNFFILEKDVDTVSTVDTNFN